MKNEELFNRLQIEIEYLSRFKEVIGGAVIKKLERLAADIPLDTPVPKSSSPIPPPDPANKP